MSPQEVEGVLRLLAVAYDRDLTKNPDLVRLWLEVLAPYDGRAVRAAALHHIALSPYWPRLSDLLAPLADADLPSEDEAWAEVLAEVHRVGLYGAPQFRTPIVAETVRRLGWHTICASEAPDVVRGQFRAFYELARQRARTHAVVQPLLEHLGPTRLPAGPPTSPPEATPE